MMGGRAKGRTPKADKAEVIKAIKAGVPVHDVAERFGLSQSRIRAMRCEAGINVNEGGKRSGVRSYADPAILFGRYQPPAKQRPDFMVPTYDASCRVRMATEAEQEEFSIKEVHRAPKNKIP